MPRSQTRTACDPRTLAPVRPRRFMRRRLHIPLTQVWSVVRWLWIAAIAGAILGDVLHALRTDGFAGITNLTYWSLPAIVAAQPGLAAALTILALLASACVFAGARLQRQAALERLKPYVLKRVRRLNPDHFVPRYVAGVYLPRTDAETHTSADAAARHAIRLAAAHKPRGSAPSPIGICIYGEPGQGKTRLAWEAMRDELPGWTVLRWPHRPLPHLDLSTLRGKSVALWIEDLHEFANPTEAVVINDLPSHLAHAGIRLVVIATCRDGSDETVACTHFGSLLDRLTAIRPATLSATEGQQLAAALQKAGVAVRCDQFDRTPGSLLLEVRSMRTEVYPSLPEEAQCVLRAFRILRSAGIYSYPLSRVRATAMDVFGMPATAWQPACMALFDAGFLRLGGRAGNRERSIEPVASVYVESAVPEYLTANAYPSDDWPWLQESLERRRDAEGLLSLGNAFSEQRTGGGPFLPYDPRSSKQHAVTCFRAALELYTRNSAPHDWAITQGNLGLALYRQAELAEGYWREDLQRQSSAAYRAALEIITYETDSSEWALIQVSLAGLFRMRAKDAVYSGDVDSACSLLREAQRYIDGALCVYDAETAPSQSLHASILRESIVAARTELDCDD